MTGAAVRFTSDLEGDGRIGGGRRASGTGTRARGRAIDIAVDPPVVPIRQRSAMTCWAAVGTMMASWRRGAAITTEALLHLMGGTWRAMFDAGAGLSPDGLHTFVRALGLKEEGTACYSLVGLARLLGEAGPLWLIADDDVDGDRILHARILTAMHGDGTVDGTSLTMADPLPGTFVTESYAAFSARLVSVDAVSFGIAVYHW